MNAKKKVQELLYFTFIKLFTYYKMNYFAITPKSLVLPKVNIKHFPRK